MHTELVSFFKKRPGYSKRILVIIFLLSIVILFARNTDILLNAQFWSEDGKYWFGQAYSSGIKSFAMPYAGYTLLLYRVIGMISTLLPLILVPLFFNIFALMIQAALVTYINTARLENIFKSRIEPLILSLLVLILPNTAEIHGNLTNTQWHLAMLCFFIIISKPAINKAGVAFDIIVTFFCSLTGPFAILLLPIAIIHRLNKKSPRKYIIYILLAGAIIQILSILFLSTDRRVGQLIELNMDGIAKIIGGQIFISSIISEHFHSIVYSHNIHWLGTIIFIFFTFFTILRGPIWLRLLNIFSILTIISMYIATKPQQGIDLLANLAIPGIGQRYFYIPMIAVTASLVWLALKGGGFMKYFSIFLILIHIFIGIPFGFRNKKIPDLNFRDYASKFEKSEHGSTITIPISPGPDYYLVLTKK